MSSPTCDGDAVTLQALCDALQITVRLVKAVDADAYNEKNLLQRLHSEGYSVLIPRDIRVEDDVASVITASDSDDAVSTSSDNYTTRGRGRAKRLFISSEIRPRSLKNIDPRLSELQNLFKGRMVWLSHIGDEAHYRYLRPAEARFCTTRSRLLVSRRETVIAQACQKKRIGMVEARTITIDCDEPSTVEEVSHSKRKSIPESNELRPNSRRSKRQIRPVSVTNISHEHWGVRTYA